ILGIPVGRRRVPQQADRSRPRAPEDRFPLVGAVKTTWLALVVAGAVALVGILPAVFVLLREAHRRRATHLALEQVQKARALVGDAEDERLDSVAEGLRNFDATTVERTVEAVLKEQDPRLVGWGRRLFQKVGL